MARGPPKLVIADSLGLDPRTVRKYVAPAEAAGIVPGGPPLSRAEWSELVRGWFPELVDARARLTNPLIAPHRALIEAMIRTNTVTTVHQRLRDEHGLAVSLTSLRRCVWAEFPDEAARDRVRVPRPAGEPGEEAQIDHGYLGRWMDPRAGRMRRVWAFVMVSPGRATCSCGRCWPWTPGCGSRSNPISRFAPIRSAVSGVCDHRS